MGQHIAATCYGVIYMNRNWRAMTTARVSVSSIVGGAAYRDSRLESASICSSVDACSEGRHGSVFDCIAWHHVMCSGVHGRGNQLVGVDHGFPWSKTEQSRQHFGTGLGGSGRHGKQRRPVKIQPDSTRFDLAEGAAGRWKLTWTRRPVARDSNADETAMG